MQHDERQMVAAAARQLAEDGLVTGTAGNVSLRRGDRLFITATGTSLGEVDERDIVVLELAGGRVDRVSSLEGRAPSTELAIHLGAYRRPEVGAVVHTHPPVACAVSTVVDELPVVHYGMLDLGGAIRVAPYETPGSPQLAERVLAALNDRRAVLLAHHGAVTLGADLAEAVEASRQLEWFAELYWRAAAIGSPAVLGEHDLAGWRERQRQDAAGGGAPAAVAAGGP
jgi:L-fuculose-phosphate aldolase